MPSKTSMRRAEKERLLEALRLRIPDSGQLELPEPKPVFRSSWRLRTLFAGDEGMCYITSTCPGLTHVGTFVPLRWLRLPELRKVLSIVGYDVNERQVKDVHDRTGKPVYLAVVATRDLAKHVEPDRCEDILRIRHQTLPNWDGSTPWLVSGRYNNHNEDADPGRCLEEYAENGLRVIYVESLQEALADGFRSEERSSRILDAEKEAERNG